MLLFITKKILLSYLGQSGLTFFFLLFILGANYQSILSIISNLKNLESEIENKLVNNLIKICASSLSKTNVSTNTLAHTFDALNLYSSQDSSDILQKLSDSLDSNKYFFYEINFLYFVISIICIFKF